MIEVTFSDSAAGGLKSACVFSDAFWESRILCLGVMADIGDIAKPMFGGYRCKLIYKMLYLERWGKDIEAAEMKDELKRLGRHYAEQYTLLERGLRKGEPVRVWYDDTAYSRCGMLWLSGLFAKYSAKVFAVELARYNDHANAKLNGLRVVRSDWGECEPHEFVDALRAERRVSKEELKANSMEWQRLANENSKLRAVIAGRVVSVPVSFYDFLIRRYLGKRPIKEAELIGKLLGENQLGVGDWWYAR